MAWLKGLYGNLLLKSTFITPLIDDNTFTPGISLIDCGIALNQNTWFKSNNPPRVHIHITTSTQEVKSLFNKLRWHKENYGVRKTVLRIMQKLKIDIINLVRRNIL